MNKLILFWYKITGKTLPVGLLQTHSANITNVFTDTMNKLKEVNENITKSAEEKDKLIGKLHLELESLDLMKEKHNKVISKIEKLFED